MVWAGLIFASILTAAPFIPARLDAGSIPPSPPLAFGGGQVFLDVSVDAAGQVTGVETLRATPPFTEALVEAVKGWRFQAALQDGQRVASKVFVGAVYGAPVVSSAPAPGEPPRDVAAPSAGLAFPLEAPAAPYPPTAVAEGVVLVEAEVDEHGGVREARVVQGVAGLEGAARDTARRWRFRAAGGGRRSLVYLAFGFRRPVLASPPAPRK